MFLAFFTSLALFVDLAAACKYVEMVSDTIRDRSLSNGIKFRLLAVPETPVTIFLESPDLDFNVCGLTYNKTNYENFQTVQAHVKPTFRDVSTPVRESFIKIGWGQNDNAHCIFEVKMEQTTSAVCVASGDPHVQTFDQNFYSFSSPGFYNFISSPQLNIQTQVGACADRFKACLKAVAISYGSSVLFITSPEGKNADISGSSNGIADMTVKNTDLGISIGFRESEIFVAKRVDSFDIQVKLDPSFSANLGGLCGQFNSTEASGEILGGDGYLFKVDSPEFFVASWKVLPSNNLFNRSSLTNDHPPTADLIKKTPFACKLYRKEINYGWDAIAGLKGYQGLPPSAIGLNQCQNPTRNQGNQTIFEAESQRLCGYHGLLVPECQHLPIEVLEFTERICQMDNREVGYLDLIEPLRQTIHRKCATILSKNLSCPKACSSRGLCSEIGCLCDPGFTGYACQNEITPRFSCPALVLKHQS